jgi:hypothetical protein
MADRGPPFNPGPDAPTRTSCAVQAILMVFAPPSFRVVPNGDIASSPVVYFRCCARNLTYWADTCLLCLLQIYGSRRGKCARYRVVADLSMGGVGAGFRVCFRWRSCGVDASVSSGGQAQLRHPADAADDDQQDPEHRGQQQGHPQREVPVDAVERHVDALALLRDEGEAGVRRRRSRPQPPRSHRFGWKSGGSAVQKWGSRVSNPC